MTPESLLIPFRTSSPPLPRLPQGYAIVSVPDLTSADLNYLLGACGELPRTATIWQRVLECSAWHLGVQNANGQWVGFIRATTDQALNANLWDLLTDPAETLREEVLQALVHTALARLRREVGGCSISLAAPPEALAALRSAGFVIDPGGIRAMGLKLAEDRG
jgi:hypothetical protein